MFNSNLIKNIILMVCGAFLAIWMGMSIVTEQTGTILQLSAVTLLIICLLLGQKIWLLYLFLYSANIVLLYNAGTVQIGQALFITFTLLIFLMRKLNVIIKFGELEFWILLVILSVAQTYIRNPVGLNLFGSGEVGGRPYIFMAMGIISAIILSCYKVSTNELKWGMSISIAGSAVGIPGNIIRTGLTEYEDGFTRLPFLNSTGQLIARWLVSYISPLRAMLHPAWALLILVSLACAAGSGYRNAIAGIGLIYTLGILYRSGGKGLIASFIAFSFLLTLIAMINLNFPLPGNIQRALSPFPGTWERRYTVDAENSSEWRYEMWKEALTSERWIKNKILGDGLGFSKTDLQTSQRMKDLKIGKLSSGMTAQQENMLINGSYHSGPVHTIRTVGYIGLAVLLLAMLRIAIHAHRLIMRYKNTEWHPLVLFFGIPIISTPIFFVFIFGEYPSGVDFTCMSFAIIRLLQRNLPHPEMTLNTN